jgi:hypothetical protein
MLPRSALVATGPAAAARRRLELLRREGRDPVLVGPPALGEQLGTRASWTREQPPAPGLPIELQQSQQALVSLLALHRCAPLDEVRFPAAGALAWATALASRQQGALPGVRLVIELEPGDELLGQPLQLGQGMRELKLRDAARAALRDADAVSGPAELLRALAATGLELGSPRRPPASSPERAPPVSVVVAHRDLGGYLPAALDSVRSQTVPAELILVDDGSGPEHLAVVADEARQDPELRVIHRLNGGPGAARNTGARAATGELLLFLDADNVLLPDCLEKLLRALAARPEAAAVVPAFHAFDEQTGALLATPQFPCDSPAGLFVENIGGDTLALHRRAAFLSVGGFSEDPSLIEDWDLWARYAAAGLWRACEPTPLFRYRVRGESRNRQLRELAVRHFLERLALLHPGLLRRCGDEVARLRASEAQAAVDRLREGQATLRSAGEEQTRRAAEALAERDALQGQLSLLLDRLQAEGARAAADQVELEARAASLQQALDEMAGSSAVRLARLLRRAAPRLQPLLGRALRALLERCEGGGR